MGGKQSMAKKVQALRFLRSAFRRVRPGRGIRKELPKRETLTGAHRRLKKARAASINLSKKIANRRGGEGGQSPEESRLPFTTNSMTDRKENLINAPRGLQLSGLRADYAVGGGGRRTKKEQKYRSVNNRREKREGNNHLRLVPYSVQKQGN